MINSVTAIGSPYVHSNNGGNQIDYENNLSAQMWNNLSQAVETAHGKINDIIANGVSETASTNTQNQIAITSGFSGDAIQLNATNGAVVLQDNGNDFLRVENNQINVGDTDNVVSVSGDDSANNLFGGVSITSSNGEIYISAGTTLTLNSGAGNLILSDGVNSITLSDIAAAVSYYQSLQTS